MLVMSCNTAHFFYPAICRFVHVPFLNMLDETAKQAVARGFGTVGLLATDGTIQTGVYADAFARQGVRAVAPDAAQQQEVMHLIYDGIKAGKPVFDIGPLTEILAALAAAGAEAVILGCTELPLAFAQYGVQSPLPLLDPTAVVAASAIRFVGGKLRGQPVGE
ncbi:MAG: amino acid racemase [Oscillospiraceae bacterium]